MNRNGKKAAEAYEVSEHPSASRYEYVLLNLILMLLSIPYCRIMLAGNVTGLLFRGRYYTYNDAIIFCNIVLIVMMVGGTWLTWNERSIMEAIKNFFLPISFLSWLITAQYSLTLFWIFISIVAGLTTLTTVLNIVYGVPNNTFSWKRLLYGIRKVLFMFVLVSSLLCLILGKIGLLGFQHILPAKEETIQSTPADQKLTQHRP